MVKAEKKQCNKENGCIYCEQVPQWFSGCLTGNPEALYCTHPDNIYRKKKFLGKLLCENIYRADWSKYDKYHGEPACIELDVYPPNWCKGYVNRDVKSFRISTKHYNAKTKV